MGGYEALKVVLSALPEGFAIPVVIVLHRGRDSGESLMDSLQKVCRLPVVEAEDKQPIEPGKIYLAPADYHLMVERDFGFNNSEIRNPKSEIVYHFALSIEEPVHYARPAIDVLFESAAEAFGAGVIGIILTGNSEDGAKGMAAIKARGGLAIVQDPKTAEAPMMPEAAIKAAKVDQVLSLEGIGEFLNLHSEI